ncbi:MAG: Hsp20/alpha crystallin family protein [Bacteroidales bacterium]
MTLVQCKPAKSAQYGKPGMLRFSDLLEDFFEMPSPAAANVSIRPRTNVKELTSEYLIDLIVPGFSRSNIELKIDNGDILVTGELKEEPKEEGSYLRREFVPARFERRFELPENVESEKINARYEDGILRIHLPKKPESVKKGPVSISIN